MRFPGLIHTQLNASQGRERRRTTFFTLIHSSSSAPNPANLTQTSFSPDFIILSLRKLSTSYQAPSCDDLASNSNNEIFIVSLSEGTLSEFTVVIFEGPSLRVQCIHINKTLIWTLINSLQRHYFLQIETPSLLNIKSI